MFFDLPPDIRQIIFRKARWIVAKDRLDPLLKLSVSLRREHCEHGTRIFLKINPTKMMKITSLHITCRQSTYLVSIYEFDPTIYVSSVSSDGKFRISEPIIPSHIEQISKVIFDGLQSKTPQIADHRD